MEKETCKICDGKGFVEKKYETTWERAANDSKKQCPHCEGYGFMIIKNKKR